MQQADPNHFTLSSCRNTTDETSRRVACRFETSSAESGAWLLRQTKNVVLGFGFGLTNHSVGSDALTGVAGK